MNLIIKKRVRFLTDDILYNYVMIYNKDSFAPLLAKSRTEAGLSQQQMADKLGVGKSTLKRWEKGDNAIPSDKLFTWFEKLNKPFVKYYVNEFHNSEVDPYEINYVLKCVPDRYILKLLKILKHKNAQKLIDMMVAYLKADESVQDFIYNSFMRGGNDEKH